MRRAICSLFVAAMVVLAGCSAVSDTSETTPTPTAATPDGSGTQLSTTVTFPNGGVAGEVSVATVAVENRGDTRAEYNATLTADGDPVASRSVTLSGGESTTVSLTHTFQETGEYDLSVANETATITVYETFSEFTSTSMDGVETARIDETTQLDATVTSEGRTVDVSTTSEATILKNFDAETLYKNGTSTVSAAGTTETERVQEWVVDGTRYSKTVPEDGATTYRREPADEFTEDDDSGNVDLLRYLSFDHTDEEYVIVVAVSNSTEASELWASFGGGSESLPASSITSLSMEIRYDRQTGRLTEQVFRASGEGGAEFESFDATFRQEYVAYGEPVSVEVPETVREEATRGEETDDGESFMGLSTAS